MTYGTHFWGLCDRCRTAKHFGSEEARDEWESGHPHGEEDEPEVKPEPTDRYSQDREAAGL